MQVHGSDLTFRRCPRCEAKSWVAADDHDVPLSQVLELARNS